MTITEKTKLREMGRIAPLAEIAGYDLIKECERFALPVSVRGVVPVVFTSVSFNNLSWFWDISDGEEFILAVCEVFFYPQISGLQRFLNPDSEKWARKWLMGCPLIDFYRFVGHVTQQVKTAAEQFKDLKIPLTPDEKAAGYGDIDPLAVKKIIDTFALRQHIQDLEDAGNRAWVLIHFALKVDIDNGKKQRKFNEILTKKKK